VVSAGDTQRLVFGFALRRGLGGLAVTSKVARFAHPLMFALAGLFWCGWHRGLVGHLQILRFFVCRRCAFGALQLALLQLFLLDIGEQIESRDTRRGSCRSKGAAF
jgi:hypothetical protein